MGEMFYVEGREGLDEAATGELGSFRVGGAPVGGELGTVTGQRGRQAASACSRPRPGRERQGPVCVLGVLRTVEREQSDGVATC